MGSALAGRLVALGYQVTISNSRGSSSLRDIEERTEAKAFEIAEAVSKADWPCDSLRAHTRAT